MTRRSSIWLLVSCILPFVLFAVIMRYFDVSYEDIVAWLQIIRSSPYAWPLTIVLFCALAFIGAPQWALLAGTAVVFGPWEGSLVSWVASLASAASGFWLGRVLGMEPVARMDAKFVKILTNAVRRNGFMTSLVIRLVPTGPAIFVNLASGVAGMKFWHFMAGTAIGILPKIIIVALISQGVISGVSGSLLGVALAVVAVGAVVVYARVRRRFAARLSQKLEMPSVLEVNSAASL